MQSFVVALAVGIITYALWTRHRRHRIRADVKNLPGPAAKSWLTGNMEQLYDGMGWDFNDKILPKYGGAARLHGFFGEDVVHVTDLEALRTILFKDHTTIFDETPMIIEQTKLLWGSGIFSVVGDVHKGQRKLMNPIFSMNRMRDLTPLFYQISHQLEATLASKTEKGPAELDMFVWMSRLSLELIGQAGLGVSFDNLSDGAPPDEYIMATKKIVPLTWPLQGFMYLLPSLVKLGPAWFRRFLCKISPHPNIRELERIFFYLYDRDTEVFYKKRQALATGGEAVNDMVGQGKDIVSILIQANEKLPPDQRLGDDELIPQMGTLLFAGHETTSGALCRILYLLANDQKRQDRLRKELQEARKQHGDLSYNDVRALPYLDAICRESLRLYAPVSKLHRSPRKDTIVPLGVPVTGRDGRQMKQFLLPEGTTAVIAVSAVNRSEALWGPTADEWIPERWFEPLPEAVQDIPGVYSNMMTFLGGARACLGFRFAEIEMKVALYILLSKFKFEATKNITWHMYNFASPSIEGEPGITPSLPLKVSLAPLE